VVYAIGMDRRTLCLTNVSNQGPYEEKQSSLASIPCEQRICKVRSKLLKSPRLSRIMEIAQAMRSGWAELGRVQVGEEKAGLCSAARIAKVIL